MIFKGEYEAAIEIINREPSELWRLVGQAIASFALGRTSESDVALNELIQQYSDDWAYYIAVVFAYRGESDRAFDWLHKAIQNSEPLLANLHDDSRWLPFLQSIGMAPEQLAAIEFRSELPDLNW